LRTLVSLKCNVALHSKDNCRHFNKEFHRMVDVDKIILYGAGSSLIVDLEETCLRCGIEVIAIINNYPAPPQAMQIEKVVTLNEHTLEFSNHRVFIALFTPGNRKFAYEEATRYGAKHFAPLIDPTAILPTRLVVEEGVYINSGVVIGAQSRLGAFSFVNRATTLGHHAIISEYASIGPGVVTGAHVKVGQGAVIGAGATILPGISIGNNAVIGGGAVVTQNVPNNTLVVGNPAKIKKAGITGYNEVSV
jgi:sugar O-acyltransferase (sialic acid O-acetyltransferase NeuD family)